MKNVDFVLLILVIRKNIEGGEKKFYLTMGNIQQRRLIYLTRELFFPFFYAILLISIYIEPIIFMLWIYSECFFHIPLNLGDLYLYPSISCKVDKRMVFFLREFLYSISINIMSCRTI